MKASLESLLYQYTPPRAVTVISPPARPIPHAFCACASCPPHRYKVNAVVSGHVHAYERSYPTFNGTRVPDGVQYLNVGDGGNREGVQNPMFMSHALSCGVCLCVD